MLCSVNFWYDNDVYTDIFLFLYSFISSTLANVPVQSFYITDVGKTQVLTLALLRFHLVYRQFWWNIVNVLINGHSLINRVNTHKQDTQRNDTNNIYLHINTSMKVIPYSNGPNRRPLSTRLFVQDFCPSPESY